MATRRGKERKAPAPDESGAEAKALPELVRRALTAGFSGFFVTEEVVRRALGDTLPKDWSDFAVDQSGRARAEFLERLSFEIGRSIENIDMAAVLTQLLEGRTLEITAKIRLAPSEDGQKKVHLTVDRGAPRK